MNFGISIQELTELHKEQGLDKLNAFGGLKGLTNKLQVSLNAGVGSSTVACRQAAFGENMIPEKPLQSYFWYVVEGFRDFTIRLLCVCALMSIVIAVTFERDQQLSWLDGAAILGTVAAVTNIQALQDWTRAKSFARLNADASKSTVYVLRDGTQVEIDKRAIVVGDLVSMAVGDILEADGVLVKGDDIECDESALTGEPEDIKKDAEDAPFMFSGSSVKSGSGMYMATAVGSNSVSGRITALVRGHKLGDSGDGTQSTSSAVSLSKARSALQAVRDEEAPAPLNVGEVSECTSAASSNPVSEESWLPPDEPADNSNEDASVLRRKLDGMVGRIAFYAFACAAIASLVMMTRHFFDTYIFSSRDFDFARDAHYVLEALLTGIAIVVVAVPEGLPLAVTLSLSLSTRKMQRDQNLVKHLDATETMGSATTICSDKTGTLTQNRMTVVRAYLENQEFVGKYGNDQTCGKVVKKTLAAQDLFAKIGHCICLSKDQNTSISWDTAADRWEQKGNKTDCALLAFADDLGFKYEDVRASPHFQVKDPAGQSVLGLKTFPFSSLRKRSAQAVPLTENPRGPCRIYVKGASEIVLRLCSQEFARDGASLFPPQRKYSISKNAIDKFASNAMRTIVLAYRDFPEPPIWEEELDADASYELTGQLAKTYVCETELTMLAVLGIHDPIREGVPEAIARCRSAGIDVRMVTGDHEATAVAIAKECGILRSGVDYEEGDGQPLSRPYAVMTGEQFRKKVLLRDGRIDLDQFDKVWPALRVLARSSPEDKYTLVTGLRETDLCETEQGKQLPIAPYRQVVAVTGDGTNDAPALRKAHVGFAMKITGTRVAQDAADILLLDDNFESVVKACMWGRNVYDSIAKFLQFQLTVNIAAVSITVLGAVVVRRPPFTVVQMLWVNLIMDSLGALALAAEPPTPELLDRVPHGRDEGLISFEMMLNIVGQAVYQFIVLLLLLFAGAGSSGKPADEEDGRSNFQFEAGGILGVESGIGRGYMDDPTQHFTTMFNCFVLMTLFNWINCRNLHHELNPCRGLLNNPTFCVIWITCLVVQVVLVQIADLFTDNGVNVAFKTRALSFKLWAICIGFAALSVFWQWCIAMAGPSLRSLPCFAKWGHAREWRPDEVGKMPSSFSLAPIQENSFAEREEQETAKTQEETMDDPSEEHHRMPKETIGGRLSK